MVGGPVGVALRKRLSDGDVNVDGQSRTEAGLEGWRFRRDGERMTARPCILLEMRSYSTLRLNSGDHGVDGHSKSIYIRRYHKHGLVLLVC